MSRFKKLATLIMTIGIMLLAGLMAHNVYAGKPVISLNFPVSFPVDI